jgi:hypothetical protein
MIIPPEIAGVARRLQDLRERVVFVGGMIRTGNANGALMGLVVGDALGTTHEFRRDLRPPAHTEVTAGGPFRRSALERRNARRPRRSL